MTAFEWAGPPDDDDEDGGCDDPDGDGSDPLAPYTPSGWPAASVAARQLIANANQNPAPPSEDGP